MIEGTGAVGSRLAGLHQKDRLTSDSRKRLTLGKAVPADRTQEGSRRQSIRTQKRCGGRREILHLVKFHLFPCLPPPLPEESNSLSF